jgi:hypothetical protein
MKNWKVVLLIVGALLLAGSFAVYAARIASCYPPAKIYAQYPPEYIKGFRETCKFDSSLTIQFSDFLWLFIPGIALFSSYWFLTRPKTRTRRAGQLSAFLLLIMFDSLLVMLYGLFGYPVPGNASAPAAWAVETIATLGFLCYLASLALWHWKRWGLLLFQAASIALAVFILIGGGSVILAAVIVGGVIVLSLLLRPVRSKMV